MRTTNRSEATPTPTAPDMKALAARYAAAEAAYMAAEGKARDDAEDVAKAILGAD